MPVHKDCSGQKFNHLEIIKFDHKDEHGRYFYLCKCDCGNEKVMNVNSIKNGHAKTCGCSNAKRDITGNVYGRLTAIKEISSEWNKEKKKYLSLWLFRCECGNEKIINKTSVMRGLTLSCGCLNKELTIKRNLVHNLYKTEKRLYRCWQDMKNRCYNKNRKKYARYGGRGIKVCDEWLHSFENFYNWAINNGYEEHLTLDRIDVNGNYCPENCRWATWKEQANNTSKNHKITLNGVTKNLHEWLKIYNISSSSYYRLSKRGFSDDEIFQGLF